jgi:hypothetical protein
VQKEHEALKLPQGKFQGNATSHFKLRSVIKSMEKQPPMRFGDVTDVARVQKAVRLITGSTGGSYPSKGTHKIKEQTGFSYKGQTGAHVISRKSRLIGTLACQEMSFEHISRPWPVITNN